MPHHTLVGWGKDGGSHGTRSRPRLATKLACNPQIFTEHLLRSSYCSRDEGYNSERNRQRFCSVSCGGDPCEEALNVAEMNDCLRRNRMQNKRESCGILRGLLTDLGWLRKAFLIR